MAPEARSGRLTFRVINNTAAFLGGNFGYHLVNFLAGVLIARSLGNEGYGQFSFIFVYLSFFEIIAQFGLNSVLTRELAQNPEDASRLLGNAILLRLALSGLAIPLALFLVRGLAYPVSVQEGVFLASFQLFLTLRSIYETLFRVKLLMIYPALWNLLRALLNLIFVGAAAYFSPSIPLFILVYLVSGLAALAGLAFFSHRFIRIRFRPDWNLIGYLMKESAPLVMSGYLTLVYSRIDILMLSKMKGFSEVGSYSVAVRLTEPFDLIANSLTISLLPLSSVAFKENRKDFEEISAKAFLGLLLIGLPMALGGSLIAPDLILLFFGPSYAPSGVTLAILFWYNFFGFFSILLVNLLMAAGKQVVDAWISFLLVLGNIGMNLWLIPRFSYDGAALATVVTEILGTAVMLIYLSNHPAIRLPLPAKELTAALKVNLPFLILLIFLKGILRISLFPLILIGVVSYVGLLLLLRVVPAADLKNYFSHWKGRR